MQAPIWLRDEPEIAALLHAVLDRFDGQPGTERSRSIVLPAERHLPTLQRGDEAADQIWSLIGDLQKAAVLEIRGARRSIYDPEWKQAKLAFAPSVEPLLREWLERPPAETVMQAWRAAVQARAHLFASGCEALLARRIAIGGRTPEEIVAALARIGSVNRAATLRQLSAFAFWGDSKILDHRGELIAALFPQLQVRDRAIVVAVRLPALCEGVLFIENQDTYTSGAQGRPASLDTLALVYASGFRAAAERVRSRDGALLHYSGPGVVQWENRFDRWWCEGSGALGPCYFWGDLDFAGMQILRTLRARFGDVTTWRPGYEPLLAILRSEGGYRSSGEGQVDPGLTGCNYADTVLLPAIRRYGQTDQERLRDESVS